MSFCVPGHKVDDFGVGRGRALVPCPVLVLLVPLLLASSRLLYNDGDALLQGVQDMVPGVRVPIDK